MSYARFTQVRAEVLQWSVTMVGITLLIAAALHYLKDPAGTLPTLLETLILAGLSLSVLAIGVGLARAETDKYQLATVLRFCLVGGLGGILLSGWIVQLVGLRGLGLRDVSFVALTMVATGSSAGSFFGLNQLQLRRRTAALIDSTNRLEEFTGIVSHDLRNPLNQARGYLQQARETGNPEHFDAVEDAHEQMEQLVREVGTLASMKQDAAAAGDLEPIQPIDDQSVASEIWEQLRTEDTTLRIEVDGSVMAEERRLRTMLRNLLQNAIQHAGPSVTVVIGEIESGFFVADDGVGIPPERREKVWRGGYTTDRDRTGFGLAIVRRIAEAHDWRMRICEGRNGGTRIEFSNVDRQPVRTDGGTNQLSNIWQL